MVYLRLLSVPRVGPLVGAMVLARLSIGINALAIVLFLREERGSFAVAGVVAGALALGTGLGAPLQGRLVDRLGARAMLPVAGGHATGLLALLALGSTAAPTPVLCAVALLAGGSMPPVSSVLRTRYRVLLADHPELVRVAFAFDSVVTELIFVLGPLLVAALVAWVTPGAALAVSAATVVAGTALFLVLLPGRGARPERTGAVRPSRMGALASPGIRALVLTMIPFGATFGMLEVVLPAFARAHDDPGMAGVLIAIWSVASAAGGFVLGTAERRRPLADVHLLLALAVPVLVLPLALAPSMAVMALLVLPAGLPIAPLIATRNELAGAVSPEGSETEAYTWVITAMISGVALGAAAAGPLVDAEGWRAAAVAAGAAAGIGAAIALAARPALRASVAASS